MLLDSPPILYRSLIERLLIAFLNISEILLFRFWVEELYCDLNYHDQKIRRTLMHDIRKHWTAVSTLLGLISSVYRNLHHWRSNQWPQIAEPKLYNWAMNPVCTQVTPNYLVIVIAWPVNLNVSCKLHLYPLQRTGSPPGPRLPKTIRNTHPRNYYDLKSKDINLHFLF